MITGPEPGENSGAKRTDQVQPGGISRRNPPSVGIKVLIILGHPRMTSFCASLAQAYRRGAEQAGAELRFLSVASMDFQPDVYEDCPSNQTLEEDLDCAQELIRWADHLVWVYPNWWGTMPARMKGFLDRTLIPGFAFRIYREDEGAGWAKLLNGRTAELISTMDMPAWVYRWIYRQPGNQALKRATLEFCGIQTTRITNLGPVRESTREQRAIWLSDIERLGTGLRRGPTPRGKQILNGCSAWVQALRLQFYPMSWVAYTVGALAIRGVPVFSDPAYWLGYAFLFSLEAATVFSNEYFDYPTDRENTFSGPFNGGSRVLVDGKLGPDALRIGLAAALIVAGTSGATVLMTASGSFAAMIIVMAGLTVLALGYTIPPFKLAYRSFGEADVAVTHSIPLILCGYIFMGGTWYDTVPWLLGLPILLATLPAITLAGIPDSRADRSAGKMTLAVRFGPAWAIQFAMITGLLAAAVVITWHRMDLIPGAYTGAVYWTALHSGLLFWLCAKELQADLSHPRRLDGLMIVALSYTAWFGLIPLFSLL